jgi:hypothetical protein
VTERSQHCQPIRRRGTSAGPESHESSASRACVCAYAVCLHAHLNNFERGCRRRRGRCCGRWSDWSCGWCGHWCIHRLALLDSPISLGLTPEVNLTGAASDVRFGSLADITARSRHVRFTSDSGHSSVQVGCPKSAITGSFPSYQPVPAGECTCPNVFIVLSKIRSSGSV